MRLFDVHAAAMTCMGAMASSVASLVLAAALPTYTCKMTKETIQIDGVLNEKIWGQVDTMKFLENTGGGQLVSPRQSAKAYATWDSTNLYVAYVTSDNDIKGTYTAHDASLYNEEAVELFFDADGDGTTYIELEWNCKNTSWDGLLPGGTAWTASGMVNAVKLRGTANNSSDVDTGMTVEVKVPWRTLDTNMSRHVSLPPKNNDQMRINFYRIDQRTNISTQDLSAWSPTMNATFHTPAKFGTIVFSTVVPTGTQSRPSAMTVSGFMQSLSVKAVDDVPGTFRISYYVPSQSDVRLTVCSVSGKTVSTLAQCQKTRGMYETVWNGTDAQGNRVKNGVYCVNIRVNGRSDVSMIKIIR
jgi:hypothetical protein